MTDREMLEFAAKVGGVNLDLTLRPDGKPLGCSYRGLAIVDAPAWWNPLADDGDALRLAVKLGLVVCVLHSINLTGVSLPAKHIEGKYGITEHHNGDPLTATRRAIVRAAAEIGKDMK